MILVADIDRGGVFASLVGTLELLEADDRARVAGLVVNKFRGDPKLFEAGVAFLEDRLQRPVLGVVPWIDDLGISEEDSLGLAAAATARRPVRTGDHNDLLDVAVIRLPHVANFDDFDLLGQHPAVTLRYISAAESLGQPDLIILPGTKTTRADLEFLRQAGLAGAIQEFAAGDGAVLGICGGFQMLGERIEDPQGVEGPPGMADGLGLLRATSAFGPEKATVQVTGRLSTAPGLFGPAAGVAFSGYEIHMGHTRTEDPALTSIQAGDGRPRADGAVSESGWVAGTYIHGLLQNAEVVEGLVASLAARRGIAAIAAPSRWDPYDRLADVLRESLNVLLLRSVVGLT